MSNQQNPTVVAAAYPIPSGTRSKAHLSPLAQRRAILQSQEQGPGGRIAGKGNFLNSQISTSGLQKATVSGGGQIPSSHASSLLSAPSTSTFAPAAYTPSAPTGGLAAGLIESKGPDIIERPRDKTENNEVALSSLAFLYGEMVSYVQGRVSGIAELEKRLSLMGYRIGQKLLAITTHRLELATNAKNPKRETRLLPVLLWIHTHLWKHAFGKAADSLERSTERSDEYMISTNVPVFSKNVSIPKDMSQLSIEAITAGIVEGALDGLGFPARVTAHSVPTPEYPYRTTILIKLDPAVMTREEALGA